MSFKATNVLPESGYRNAKILAVNVKGYCVNASLSLQTDTNADQVIVIFHDCRRFKADFDSIKLIPGIAQYAKDQEQDQGYDVTAEFVALISAIEAVMAEIKNTFPVDADGYLLEKKLNAQGTYNFRQFTPTQTATLRSLLAAVANEVV